MLARFPRRRISTNFATRPSLLLAGSLCFRRPETRPFTFKAFDLNKQHRDAIERKLAEGADVVHADVKAEGFGFGLESALGRKLAEDEDDDTAFDDAEVQTGRATVGSDGTRAGYRRLGIETVLGFWIPTPYVRLLQRTLEAGEERRRSRLDALAEKLAITNDVLLRDELGRHIASLQELFKGAGLGLVQPAGGVDANFGRFIQSRRDLLGDPKTIKRLPRRFILTPMPNIWGDERAVEAFLGSFFEDQAYRLSAPSHRSHIVKVLAERLGINKEDAPGITAETPRELLEDQLTDQPWRPLDWALPTTHRQSAGGTRRRPSGAAAASHR